MKFLGIHFHSWEFIYETKLYTYRGEDCSYKHTDFRRCKECGEIQEKGWDGTYWDTLNDCQTKVLNKQIYKENNKLMLKEVKHETRDTVQDIN